MRIDRRLNLVVPIMRDDGSTIYVHSTPISRAVFEDNFMLIGRAFAAINSSGLGFTAGPRVAAMIIKKVAEDSGGLISAGSGDLLMNEIRRLSNVIVPVDGQGYQTMPYETALARDLLSEDEVAEAENAICFFIVASAMFKKAQLAAMMSMATTLWDTEITLSNVTEYVSSLATLKKDETIGETEIISSHPY